MQPELPCRVESGGHREHERNEEGTDSRVEDERVREGPQEGVHLLRMDVVVVDGGSPGVGEDSSACFIEHPEDAFDRQTDRH